MYQQGKMQKEWAITAGVFAALLAFFRIIGLADSDPSSLLYFLYMLAWVPLLVLCSVVMFRQKRGTFALTVACIGIGLELLYMGGNLLVLDRYGYYYPDLSLLAMLVVAGWSCLPKNRDRQEPVAAALGIGLAASILLNQMRYLVFWPENYTDPEMLFTDLLPTVVLAGFVLSAGMAVGLKPREQLGRRMPVNSREAVPMHGGLAIAAGAVTLVCLLFQLIELVVSVGDGLFDAVVSQVSFVTIYELLMIPLIAIEAAVFLRRKWDNFAMVVHICLVSLNLLLVLSPMLLRQDYMWYSVGITNIMLLWVALPQNRNKDKMPLLLVFGVFALETLIWLGTNVIQGHGYYLSGEGLLNTTLPVIASETSMVLMGAALAVGSRGVTVPQAPVYQQPVYQQPVYQQPVYQQPVYQQPVYQQPAYQQPVYQQPVYQQPVYQQPVYQQPVYQQPVYQQPVYQQPVYQQPMYQQPVYQQPVQQPAPQPVQQPAPQPEQPAEQTENP